MSMDSQMRLRIMPNIDTIKLAVLLLLFVRVFECSFDAPIYSRRLTAAKKFPIVYLLLCQWSDEEAE